MTEQKQCNGICLSGYDIGVPSPAIAYAHPECDLHGDPDMACPCCEGWGSHYGDWKSPVGTEDAFVCTDCDAGTVSKDKTDFTCKGRNDDRKIW